MTHSEKTLLIVYHSMTGGSQQMAEAVARGARAETQTEVKVSLCCASEAAVADVLDASAYVFATPEYLGSMSGLMKDFFDRTYYGALERLNGRAYSVLVCAGSDGRGASAQVQRIATGWRLRAAAPPLIVCTHAQTPHEILSAKIIPALSLDACEQLGATLAAGLALGMF